MSIRLAFSGGGFRATLFHLGVVRWLYEAGKLSTVTDIYAVSGGSILAAHLILNWAKYTGKQDQFQQAAASLIEFSGRDVRGRIVRAWLFAWLLAVTVWFVPPNVLFFFGGFSPLTLLLSLVWMIAVLVGIWWFKERWSLIKLLEQQYATWLYDGKKLMHLTGDRVPDVQIMTTNLTTGDLCSFDQSGFHVWHSGAAKDYPQPEFPVALAVAASSAFPPLFSPVRLRKSHFAGESDFSIPQSLADGGIFDNLGIRGMYNFGPRAPLPANSLFLLSDAQGVFDPLVDKGFGLLPERATRSSDILMYRVSEFETQSVPSRLGSLAGVEWHHLCLWQRSHGRASLTANMQKLTASVRTDFDCFSPLEIQLLVYQGYYAAQAAFTEGPPSPQDGVQPTPPDGAYDGGWNPTEPLAPRAAANPTRALRRSSINRPNLFHPLSLISWLTLVLLLSLVALSWPSLTLLADAFRSHSQTVNSLPPRYIEQINTEAPKDLIKHDPWLMLLSDPGLETCSDCQTIVLETVSLTSQIGDHPAKNFRCRLRCTEDDFQIAGVLFLIAEEKSTDPRESSRSFHLLKQFSWTRSEEVGPVQATNPKSALLLVVQLKRNNTNRDFPKKDELARLITLEVVHD